MVTNTQQSAMESRRVDSGDAPELGALVRDTGKDRMGVVMAKSRRFTLRPPGGGVEWDQEPEFVRVASPAEVLSEQVRKLNTQASVSAMEVTWRVRGRAEGRRRGALPTAAESG